MDEIFNLRASGPIACFTRPGFKVERVSYTVITPSAARGIFEAILWRPAMRWIVTRIYVLNRPAWISFRTNELIEGMTLPGGSEAAAREILCNGGIVKPFIAEEHRTQRNTLALRDVDYILSARIELTEKAGPRDTYEKFSQMFHRRLSLGQHFQMPYFGMREFVANVRPVDEDETPVPIPDSADLGRMVYDIDYSGPQKRVMLFEARMQRGIVDVPSPNNTNIFATEDADDPASLAPAQ